MHECRVWRNDTCFVLAERVEDNNDLLAATHEFSQWSGMDLCICKCEITGYNFASGEEVLSDRVHINGRQLMLLSPH